MRARHGFRAAAPSASPQLDANAFVDQVYAKLTPIYDFVFGPVLQPGRVLAVKRMNLRAGDRVLEVGVGTGLNAPLYSRDCRVLGIDISRRMLAEARQRIARLGSSVQVQTMDAAHMTFPDEF